METQAQIRQRRRPKLEVTVKTSHFLPKRSKILVHISACVMTNCDLRLSREEREAAYNKARERIFGKDEKTGDATPGMIH